jgi:hypothetical protein
MAARHMIAPLKSETDDDACRQQEERRSAHRTPSQSNPFEPLLAHVAELREYATHYWTVQKDAAKAKVRRTVLWAILGAVAGAIGVVLLATASALVLIGLSDALGVLFGDRFWAGKLAVGLGVVLLACGGLALILYRWSKSSRDRTLKQYERRHSKQRAQFGRDVPQRARS